mmetsp:Transcript_31802/g.95199  ORF Transcript_31802/g.95199 Transcript_31802/m.95199 type:complete len:497 (-) Transcript_31802:178-1668(-)|eukprot:CAMPEP_0113545272 /NCGR_PEP_ID=MMETSP0015_2-20120614/11170_1 /TAXON_ID=2838 /ORGANISM="Odontella" /LENGTH=496 /DNA_ID=CAMNT_0000445621 /DNA_START=210 /DNA_END=1700 /DNA_ORIENTATION=+ /assembly_acc=CAM_ASM_000160
MKFFGTFAVAIVVLLTSCNGSETSSVRGVDEVEKTRDGTVAIPARKLEDEDADVDEDEYLGHYETGSCTCAKEAYMAVYKKASIELKMIPLLSEIYPVLQGYIHKLVDYAVCSLHAIDCGCQEGFNYFPHLGMKFKVSTYQCCCDVDVIKDIIVNSIMEVASSWSMNHGMFPAVDTNSVMKRKLFHMYQNSLDQTAGAVSKIGGGMYFDSDTCEKQAFCGNNGGALDPETANILHCIDANTDQPSVWTTYFTDKSYINYVKIGGSNTNPNGQIRDQCRSRIFDGTKWDAIIMEEVRWGYRMTVMPETILWARKNPDRPLIYHDTYGAFFHYGNDAVTRRGPDITNYSTAYPTFGGAFGGFAPLTVGSVTTGGGTNQLRTSSSLTLPESGGVVEATHDMGGSAIVRNGNVWGMGPIGAALSANANTVMFPYLEAILCCRDCCLYTPFPQGEYPPGPANRVVPVFGTAVGPDGIDGDEVGTDDGDDDDLSEPPHPDDL